MPLLDDWGAFNARALYTDGCRDTFLQSIGRISAIGPFYDSSVRPPGRHPARSKPASSVGVRPIEGPGIGQALRLSCAQHVDNPVAPPDNGPGTGWRGDRSEERRVGQGGVRTRKARG